MNEVQARALHGRSFMLLDRWLERHGMRELPGRGLIFSGDEGPNPRWCLIGTDGRGLMESPATIEGVAHEAITLGPAHRGVKLLLMETSGGAHVTAGGDLLVANDHDVRYVKSIWIDVTDTPEAKSPLSTGLRCIDSDAVTQFKTLAHIERIAKFFGLEGNGYQVGNESGVIDD